MKTPDVFDLLSPQNPEGPQHPESPAWHPTASQSRGMTQLHELADVFHKLGDGLLAGFPIGRK